MHPATHYESVRTRLDAIGSWQIDEVEDAILWREPPILQNSWVPFDLRFAMEMGDDVLDDRHFALWERYLSLHQELVPKFRQEAEAAFAQDEAEPFGKRAVTRACIWVRRTGEEDDIFHALEVTFSVPQDEDHGYYATFDEESGKFESFSCS